jgi:hypothetical protein
LNYFFNIKKKIFSFKDVMELLIVLIILMKIIVYNVMEMHQLFHVIRNVS